MANDATETELVDQEAEVKTGFSISGLVGKLQVWVRESKLRLVGVIVLPLLLAAACLLLFGSSHTAKELLPEEKLDKALALLDESSIPESLSDARQIGAELDRINYRDPRFPGGPEYIQGIVIFREAEKRGEDERDPAYRISADFLTSAGHRGVNEARNPEWSYSLGKSLFHLSNFHDAATYLQKAIDAYPPGLVEATLLLQELNLHQRTVASLNRALELNTTVLKSDDLLEDDLDRILRRRAEILVTLGRVDEAKQALEKMSVKNSSKHSTQVVRAQIELTEERFAAARDRLKPIASEAGLENDASSQASYLIGLSYELEKDYDNATAAYGETTRQFLKSPDGLQASLRRAALLRDAARTEEALVDYLQALRMVKNSDAFSNRWLTLGEFRKAILDASNVWTEAGEYEAAIELSKHMANLFGKIDARRQAASAYEKWARQLETELAGAKNSVRNRRELELHQRWQRSGKAYERLAEALISSPLYSDALWTSAEHYRKGHVPERELNQLNKFISTNSQARMALAYVRRGQVLMDLDRLDEAMEHFEKVVEDYDADIAVFEARYMIGSCYLEQNLPDRAEQAWRAIVTSRDLTPSANEWQLALFSLGRLLYHTGIMLQPQSAGNAQADNSDAPNPEAHARWENSIRRLEEFVTRYPRRPEAREARLLLAKALQNMAEKPRFKLRRAETENARNELLGAMRTVLSQAYEEFTILQEQLVEADKLDMLDELGQQILRDCYFERAHTLYELDEFVKAISAYTSAVNRYPEDPQILLAYLQIANCYSRMGKNSDARGAAIQALLIHKNIPEKAFQDGSSNISRDEWVEWLEWAKEIYQTLPTSVQRLSSISRDPS